jgi:hypothetical protein
MVLGYGCMIACYQAGSTEQSKVDVNFNAHSPGAYTDGLVKRDWQGVRWVGLQDRASIVLTGHLEHGHALQIRYPKGSVGPGEGGGQFLVSLHPAEEYWLTYDLQFNHDFDFKLGGKLPGLTSGGAAYTGGHRPVNGDGWSARYMWGRGGKAIVYFYSVDMPGKWGESLRLDSVVFKPGQWHRLTQHIKVNTPGERDGILEVWFDGKKVLARDTLRFRIGEKGVVDSFYFSTFHGGNTADWAPQVDCFALFDNFVIDQTIPDYLGK